ncbi:MAG TPA: hypothetical protein VFL87_08310 [Thermoleophilaceae bacterium]|nr:hypothetical protein [Thermoleophilaceae bacterium]
MTRRSALRLKALIGCAVVIATAAFVVWAVQSSIDHKTVVNVGRVGGPPPQPSPVTVRLANAIGRASLGRGHRGVDMARVAPFAWDRVYVFASETSVDIHRRLGFAWKDAPAAVPRSGEHESLIAFVRGRRVVAASFFADAIGQLGCLSAPGGYVRGTAFVVRFTRSKPPAPYLSDTRPAGADAACLHAVGAR